MQFYIYAYVQTALVDCVPLVNTDPTALIGDASPSASNTGTAVEGTIYWNSFDSANGNSFVFDAKKICLISNSDATDSVIVTFATLNTTEYGLAVTKADFSVTVAAGKLAVVPNLPSIFKDGTLVKISIAESGGTAITDTRIAVVKIT